MPLHDFRSQRLFLDQDLAAGIRVALDREQANYLINVLRMKAGERLLVFNGRDGEWLATIAEATRRSAALALEDAVRAQEDGPDIVYLFAPLKRARLDYMVQKATEMGVAAMQPVFTDHTQAERTKPERMQANIVEAAEQCGVLRLPELRPPAKLAAALDALEPDRVLIFCDERAAVADALHDLRRLAGRPLAVLVGPEGGFSQPERDALSARTGVVRLSLGPRIMRADTAAVAALALVNAAAGDWR